MPGTANSIITPQTPKSSSQQNLFTANTTFGTTPTNTILLVTAGSAGARLTKLRAMPQATVTATQLQEFRSTDTGVTQRVSGFALGAPGGYTMAGSTLPPIADFGYSDDNPKLLQANERLYVAVGVTGSWSFEAEWADY